MKTKMLRSLLASASLLAAAAAFGGATDWYPATPESRPYVRWWWLGSAVDPEGLTWNLSEFARQGIGGVEITPIYGVKGNDSKDIPYLSPRWMDMLAHTTSEAKRLGLQVDMNNGTGWPFGGPEVTVDESARKYIIEKFKVKGGEKVDMQLAPSDPKQRDVATISSVVAADGDRRIILTNRAEIRKGHLKWKAPKGNWTIYVLYTGRTFQKVKRAAPGGEGYVLNHYDSIAVKRYLDRFDRAFAGKRHLVPTSFFNDSYEVYGSDWTEGFLGEFEKINGYSLERYLPEFADNNDTSDLRRRVVSDYRRTLGDMLYRHFTSVWTRWAHSYGATIRNQSHGSPANIIDLYASVDIPECESFGQTDFTIPGLDQSGPVRPSDSAPAVLKFASSGAHLAGRPLTSAETLTWLTEHFRTSLARCKPEIDQMLCSGVNHVFFHGAPYSPKGVAFPGWMFYASINMSPTNSIWEDASALFQYISRCQTFLSAGNPDNDFLLYFPIEDIWYQQESTPYLMFDIHKMDRRMPEVKAAVGEVIRNGYDVDYLSDALFDKLTLQEDGSLLSAGNNRYRAIIVPAVELIPEQTLERLVEFARNGATVIFTGRVPSDVPGLSELKQRREKFAKIAANLPKVVNVAMLKRFGNGTFITAPTITEALKMIRVKPEQLRRDGVHMIRRTNEAGGHNYFISLLKNAPINGFVPLATYAESAMIFDPLTGSSGMAEIRHDEKGVPHVRLQLAPGQSVLIKTFPTVEKAQPWRYLEPAGEPVAIDKGWSISFLNSEPAITGRYDVDKLCPWTALPDTVAKINCGTASYETKFTLPEVKGEVTDWLLNLGDVRESARVCINGKWVGKLWSVPFTARVGEYLKPGENTIRVDVTNIPANRIADYERRGVEWRIFKDTNINSVTGAAKFNFGEWPVLPAGLNSKVTLTPMK